MARGPGPSGADPDSRAGAERAAGQPVGGDTADPSGPALGRRLLRAAGLEASYGGAPVLQGVDLDVGAGEVLAVVGANGAGKTTFAAALAGLVPLSSGVVELSGTDLAGLGPAERLRRGLALVPEGRRLFQGLSVADNLRVGAHWRRDEAGRGSVRRRGALRVARRAGDPRGEDVGPLLAPVLDLLPALGPLLGHRTGSLGVAEQSLCALGRALAARPSLLVVDEPTLGLDPERAEELLAVLPDVAATGCAVVVIEADAARALSVAERAVVLARGRVVREASPGSLLSDLDFLRSYVWGSAG